MADMSKTYETLSLSMIFGIDDGNLKGQRSVPMKVLCLGMSRTGTISLKKALLRLGYGKVYHMQELIMRPEHLDFWDRATRAKWEGAPQPTKAEWDAVLGDYQAGSDNPFMAFSEELIALYPDAKVVLTNKDPDKFWKSWKNSALYAHDYPWWVKVTRALNLAGRTAETKRAAVTKRILDHQYNNDWQSERTVKRVFQEHYDNVRKWVPKERLLEYRVEEGWNPLCDFLGEAVPDERFPKGNSTKEFQGAVSLIWKVQAGMVVLQALMLGGGALALTRVANMYNLWDRIPWGRFGLGSS